MQRKIGQMAVLGLIVALVTALVWIFNGFPGWLDLQAGAGGGGAELTPCGTATVTQTSAPAPTIWEVTAFATPTPIVGGPRDFLEAWFTPALRMRLRTQPSTAATTVGYLDGGETAIVLREVFPSGAAWLFVVSPYGVRGYVAYRIGETYYGKLEIIQP